jgi:hypothetical protein
MLLMSGCDKAVDVSKGSCQISPRELVAVATSIFEVLSRRQSITLLSTVKFQSKVFFGLTARSLTVGVLVVRKFCRNTKGPRRSRSGLCGFCNILPGRTEPRTSVRGARNLASLPRAVPGFLPLRQM